MAAPSRPQIEAIVTKPTYLVEYDTGGGWTAVTSSYVLEVQGAAESSSGGENGLGFGATAPATATIRLDPLASSIAWDGTLVRVSFGFDTSDKVVRFAGVIIRRTRQGDEGIAWECAGWDELIRRTAVYSPLIYRRPASTATTASSVEDPSSGSYRAGLVNYIMWQAGGRPYEQAGSYPSATFYYSCEFSPITPEWSWVAGENAWDELTRLARACGLLIYQAADGVMKAQSALTLAGSPAYTFTASTFRQANEESSRLEKIAAVRCSYTVRRLQPEQVVYEDQTPRFIAAGASITLTVEFSQPVYTLVLNGSALHTTSYVAVSLTGASVSLTTSVSNQAASRLTLTLTNGTSTPCVVAKLTIRGRPIAPVEEGIATSGSGTPAREIGDDTGVYVQSQLHGERLTKLYLDFYGTVRDRRTLAECGYDPDRAVGEVVNLTYSPWSLSAVQHRISSVRHADTGGTMEVGLVPVSGLPSTSSVFLVGTSYSGSDSRELSY